MRPGRLASTGVKMWIAHDAGRSLLGQTPLGVDIEVYADPRTAPPSDPATVEFWVPPFLAQRHVLDLLDKMTRLRVVQLLTAGADVWVGYLPDNVVLCDARGVHDSSTSEWVVAAILAYLRAFPAFVRAQERGEWTQRVYTPTNELAGKRVLVIGAGSIGEAIKARLAPF